MLFRYLQKNIFALRRFAIAALCVSLVGCFGIPDNAAAISNFELERYLGKWYEVARLDHVFERGLSNVEAQYSLRDDGGVRVINKGYDENKGEWEVTEGRAYLVGESNVGRLKVSFFWPFYGAYNIVELDPDGYQYALVVGANPSYLWILARQPELDQAILARLVANVANMGIATDKLIFPKHDREHY
jgi:apolipoprotein D and lipocalin family protein